MIRHLGRSGRLRPAVFLDRDGTLVHDEGYMTRPSQLRLLPGVAEGLRRLASMGRALVVITNQSAVARGYCTMRQLGRMHVRLRELVRAEGVELARIYACPHRDEDRCGCRKPRPGLLLRAARDLRLDLRRSVMIGDSDRDTRAGRAVGAATVQVGDGLEAGADARAKDLVEAADWLTRRPSCRPFPTRLPTASAPRRSARHRG